jgi:uncharacterized protein (TIGR02246 family)
VLASACFAQAPADAPPEKAAISANARAYEAAYAKADVAALANFFADDAGYTADDGRSFSGRPAIEEALRAGLRANKGSKLAIAVDSVSVLAPEVVLEKGADFANGKRRIHQRLALHGHPHEEGRQMEDRPAGRDAAACGDAR